MMRPRLKLKQSVSVLTTARACFVIVAGAIFTFSCSSQDVPDSTNEDESQHIGAGGRALSESPSDHSGVGGLASTNAAGGALSSEGAGGGALASESGGTGGGDNSVGGSGTGGGDVGGIGGSSGGGPAAGGAPNNEPFDAPFILGADISSVQEGNNAFQDVDGATMSIFEVLKNHGFNYVRLKTFVQPDAPYGYSSTENSCAGFAEPFGDRDHVVEFGRQIKEAGMGFLLDFHYSDIWADPGNQIIPEAWRGATTIAELADRVREYTTDVIVTAMAAGARPDMVQIGNEITPGMLMHLPGPDTDCWGNYPVMSPLGGRASDENWDNLATLLKAGVDAVRAVDPSIQIMLHTENTDELSAVKWWVDSAMAHGVEFDVLGLSCYSAFQGGPSVWQNTFESLVSDPAYDGIQFVIAEYNDNRREANQIMKALPGERGLGTFFWEPTRSGEWGDAMFSSSGGEMRANEQDFAEYDELLPSLGL